MLSMICLFTSFVLGLAPPRVPEDVHDETRVLTVGKGPGEYRRIQDALDAVPPGSGTHTVILIANGVYNEKLFITKSSISVVGEDQDSTRIVYAQLRSDWAKARDNRPDGSLDDSDWGSAVINIADGVTDLTIANLTVHNNYGSLHGSHNHQFTIRGFKATRIALLHCTVISDGGDAVSLWNRETGMYYHANCRFEGWVDYVCPRGWCYIVGSEFYGHNLSASIWHDGSTDKDQKFVLRRCSFDGVEGFPLGRHHRDAQFYLLDCTFSAAMADTPIYSPKSPNTVPWVWGERHYFWNCQREGGNFYWFSDNLQEADGSPTHDQVNARWTFAGKWDPENTLPSVLPFVSIPQPEHLASSVSRTGSVLRWIPARGAEKHLVYFGEGPQMKRIRETDDREAALDELVVSTRYRWRIDTIIEGDTLTGPVWTFTTE